MDETKLTKERDAWRLSAIALFQHVFNNEERDEETLAELAALYMKAHNLSFPIIKIPAGGPYPGFKE